MHFYVLLDTFPSGYPVVGHIPCWRRCIARFPCVHICQFSFNGKIFCQLTGWNFLVIKFVYLCKISFKLNTKTRASDMSLCITWVNKNTWSKTDLKHACFKLVCWDKFKIVLTCTTMYGFVLTCTVTYGFFCYLERLLWFKTCFTKNSFTRSILQTALKAWIISVPL